MQGIDICTCGTEIQCSHPLDIQKKHSPETQHHLPGNKRFCLEMVIHH